MFVTLSAGATFSRVSSAYRGSVTTGLAILLTAICYRAHSSTTVSAPPVLPLYLQHYGAVDLHDQSVSYYDPGRHPFTKASLDLLTAS